MTQILKPCPFCGEDMLDVQTDRYWDGILLGDYVPYAFVVCPSCSARGPIAQRGTGSEEQCKVDAMRKWDKRAEPESDAGGAFDEQRYSKVCRLLEQALSTMSEWGA